MADTSNNNTVRVRFAPSPTGPLHIGGVRTALFNWLFARRHNGIFILRIEDTDRNRYVPGSLEQIIEGLKWLGLYWDEGPEVGGPYGPYIQSQRLDLYRKWANWLLEHDKAYKCYCSKERLEELRKARGSGYDRRCRYLTEEERRAHEEAGDPFVIRFKMPLEGETVINDLIRGPITFHNERLQDLILLKSDGYPTYHLANVVDDHLMRVTHIMRASEWIPTAPLHYQLYKAFGWEMPKIAHLPVILNPNGKGKLSKRTQAFSSSGHKVLVLLHEYREAGYLPEAIVNFLTNIGWSFGEDREIFSVEETIPRFELERINPAGARFSFDKLVWLNGIYIRKKSPEELAELLREPLEKAGLRPDKETLLKVAPLVQERIKTLNEVVDMAGFFFRETVEPAPKDLIGKKMTVEQSIEALRRAADVIKSLPEFNAQTLEEALRALAADMSLKAGQLFGVLRVAVTGQKVSPPLFETMEIVGRDRVLERLEKAEKILGQEVEKGADE